MSHSTSPLKTLSIVLLCLLFSCSNKPPKCWDHNDPTVYFNSTSITTGKDTSVIRSVGILAEDKYAILSNVDSREIPIAPFTNHMYLLFSQYQNEIRVTDTLCITYERDREYTGSECGFKIIARHFAIADKQLHIAKEAFIDPTKPQLIQLVY